MSFSLIKYPASGNSGIANGQFAILDNTLPSLYFANTSWDPVNPSSTSAFSINTHLSGGAVDFFCNGAFFPIFWADGSEVMRIPTSGNLLLGTVTDNGDKLQINGAISITDTITSSIGGSAAIPVFSIGGDRGMWSNSSDVLNFTAGHGNSTLTLSDNNGFGCARIGGAPTFPTAILDIQTVSDGSAGTAPIKIPVGTLLTTEEEGVFEYDGTNLYFTIGAIRKTFTLI